jgi:hypothetical protein
MEIVFSGVSKGRARAQKFKGSVAKFQRSPRLRSASFRYLDKDIGGFTFFADSVLEVVEK